MIPLETCCLGKVLRRPCKFGQKTPPEKMNYVTFKLKVNEILHLFLHCMTQLSRNELIFLRIWRWVTWNVHITSTTYVFLKYGLGLKIYKWDILSCILILVLCFSYLAYSYWDVKSVSIFPHNDLFGLAPSFTLSSFQKIKLSLLRFHKFF